VCPLEWPNECSKSVDSGIAIANDVCALCVIVVSLGCDLNRVNVCVCLPSIDSSQLSTVDESERYSRGILSKVEVVLQSGHHVIYSTRGHLYLFMYVFP